MKKILVCGHVDHGKTTLIRAMNAYFKEYYNLDTEENEGGGLNRTGRMHAVLPQGGQLSNGNFDIHTFIPLGS